ncbi:hypothetical protein ACXHQ0_15035 [Vibrio antiquarius]|uniref:Uncharacterized protein n=1 Tax=Vibrio parahaemolyticus TaxID=670 RepID=A0AA46Z5A8_VIBPH|nr:MULTISPECIES: hypothetical protein [Vibrio harveyi group]KOE95815.1 hypothetical protein ACS91_00450 [Vibrio parahaemolyticus]MCS0314387.1 hypothetical protein [Vibrio diabolicus]UYV29603.1 hypothetical protein M5598_26875 [Vibrio parahaemolyticus]UYW19353.1 hypothetical protein IF561_29420 [Vibrio parahaemolyticus]
MAKQYLNVIQTMLLNEMVTKTFHLHGENAGSHNDNYLNFHDLDNRNTKALLRLSLLESNPDHEHQVRPNKLAYKIWEYHKNLYLDYDNFSNSEPSSSIGFFNRTVEQTKLLLRMIKHTSPQDSNGQSDSYLDLSDYKKSVINGLYLKIEQNPDNPNEWCISKGSMFDFNKSRKLFLGALEAQLKPGLHTEIQGFISELDEKINVLRAEKQPSNDLIQLTESHRDTLMSILAKHS